MLISENFLFILTCKTKRLEERYQSVQILMAMTVFILENSWVRENTLEFYFTLSARALNILTISSVKEYGSPANVKYHCWSLTHNEEHTHTHTHTQRKKQKSVTLGL